ncbi:hypothetical protein C8T65DRAFT_723994 [Cerioporus squamosus]|nr:hypothetical protein C8T65DRAFT_723994 [Cerioporus squamosus]
MSPVLDLLHPMDLDCFGALSVREDDPLPPTSKTARETTVTTCNTNSPSSSNIPPELWLEVFSYATQIPGAYTHTDQQAFYAFAMDTHGISVHRRHREATDTMLVASRVCKAWVPVAAGFLVKYLVVKSGDHAVEIAAALERHVSRARGGSCLGDRTVRLELALDGVHVWTEAHTIAFGRIIAACRNLTVLSTVFSTGDCPLVHNATLVRALELGGLPSTLRRLELSGDSMIFESILPRISNALDALWIRPTGNAQLANVSSGGPLEFPRLRSLVVTDDGVGIPPEDWNTPQLKPFTTRTYLEAHGSILKTLDAIQLPRMHLRFCPNLVDCTVPISLLETLFVSVPIPPSLRCLTFDRACEVHAAWIEPRSIARFSLAMRDEQENGRLPPLESIRFLLPIAKWTVERNQEAARSEVPFWQYAVEHLRQGCQPLGIALEASVGADEHTANIWQPLSYEHFLGA